MNRSIIKPLFTTFIDSTQLSHLNTPFLDSTKIKAETAAIWKEKVKRWHSLKKKCSASPWWIAGGKERGKNVQMEGTPSAPLSDNGEKAEPITAEHKGQTDRRGMCKKIQGVRGSVKTAVSTGVIKTNSLKLCEEKKTHSHSFNLPPRLSVCVSP